MLRPQGLCEASELPAWYEAYAFVRGGYRVGYGSHCDCVRSLGAVHNETCNVWSHILGCVIFGLRSCRIGARSLEDLSVAAFTVAATLMFGLSAGYHTFQPLSKRAFQRWLVADKIGIAAMIGGSFVPGVWLGFRCQPLTVRVFWLCDAVLLTAIGATMALGRKRTYHRFVFASLVLSALAPALHWWSVASPSLKEKLAPNLVAMFAWYALGFLIYVANWPERHFPGSFDLFGASHQLWHLCILFAALSWLRNIDICLSLIDQHQPTHLTAWLSSSTDNLLVHRRRITTVGTAPPSSSKESNPENTFLPAVDFSFEEPPQLIRPHSSSYFLC